MSNEHIYFIFIFKNAKLMKFLSLHLFADDSNQKISYDGSENTNLFEDLDLV